MVKFVIEESSTVGRAEPKAPWSTSLPPGLMDGLSAAAGRLKREKAVLVRTALNLLLKLNPIEQQERVMAYYAAGTYKGPKPFTTTLTLSQRKALIQTAQKMHRPKADVFRAALHHLLLLSPKDQEKEVMEYLSS